jgi:hypothetical protein
MSVRGVIRCSMLTQSFLPLDSIPDIVKEVRAMHGQVKKDLNCLPEQVDESRLLHHLSTMVRAFDKDFVWASLHDEEEESLADDIHTFTNAFWLDML